ncbi:MAG: NHL repeat-containing protein, partial [Promethearchaeota archaeon]
NPACVITNSSGAVYVVDRWNHRVQVFDTAGTYLYTIGTTGATGTDNAHFNYPLGVAVNSTGAVYIADYNNQRVQVFDAAGNYLYTIGITGVGGLDNTHLNGPADVATNPSGIVYIADRSNYRVQVFDAAGNYMYTIGTDGEAGSDYMHFSSPFGITTNLSGAVYVADTFNHRVQVFDADGTYLYTIGTTGELSSDNGCFNRPVGVAVNSSDAVYVADWSNHRVQVFSFGSCESGSSSSSTQDPPEAPVLQPISPATSENGTVDLDWNDAPGGQSYTWDVYRSLEPVNAANYNCLTPVAINLTASQFRDQLLENDTYRYAVLAINGSGQALSNDVLVVVAIPPETPESGNSGGDVLGYWPGLIVTGLAVASVILARKRRG